MNIFSYLKQKSFILKSSMVCLKLKSSMTIYLTLVLVVIMALIFTLIESGRVSAINAKLRSITFMAADSAFAEFAQPVFDEYGIMCLWTGEEEYLDTLNGYISGNVNINETGAGADMDLYGMRFAGSELKKVDRLTDEGGQPFEEQVYDYMKVHAIKSLAEELLSRARFFEQTENARGLLGTISQYQEDFVKVEQSVSDLSDQMNHIKDLAENPKTLFEEMQGALDRYESGNNPEEAEVFSQKKRELESRDEIPRRKHSSQQRRITKTWKK